MPKTLAFIITVAILSLFHPSASPNFSLAQQSDTLAPRFGTGVAIIKRPDSLDLNFAAHMTDDGQSVIGYNTQIPDQIYIWDIADLADDIVFPDPEIVDLRKFVGRNYTGDIQIAFSSDIDIILQYDYVLVKINVLTSTQIQSTTFSNDTPHFSSLATQGDMVALLIDETDTVVLWDTASNEIAAHQFDEPISGITAIRDGWRISQSNRDAPNVNIFCDLTLDTCHRQEISGNLALSYNGILIFADTNSYSTGQDIPTTYYTFDGSVGLTPTESPFPNLPENVTPISVSPDGQFLLTLTYNENNTGGMVPLRSYEVWAIDSTQPLYSIGHTYRPYWFGDHFIAQSPNAETATLGSAETDINLDTFSIYEMRGKNGLPYDGLYDFLGGYPETSHLRQISADGTRYLHVLGGAAIVLPIEFQPIDDLMAVEDTVFSVERSDRRSTQTYLSPDGQTLVSLNPDSAELIRWDVDSGNKATLDLSSYLTEDSVFDFALRDDDLFLQIDNVLHRIALSDLSMMDEYSVDDTLTDFPAGAFVIRDEPSVADNGDTVAALFDNSTVIWHGGQFSVVDIGGMRLYPHGEGWMVYSFDFAADPELHQLTRCDLMFENCTIGAFEGPLASIRGKDMIVGGNSLLGFAEYGVPPTYWQLGPDSITPADPIFELPTPYYVPASFHDDYALVAAPAYDYDTSGRHYELWSISESRPLTRLIFRGDWAWFEDYAFVTYDHHLTIFHLPDGRFTRWTADSPISKIQLSTDVTRLLIITAETIDIVRLEAP